MRVELETGCVDNEFRPSPLALAVLSLLHAAPLHPYGMQRLLKQWGKDHVINVGQRANLYKTIRRLDQAGLIKSGRPSATSSTRSGRSTN